jgi:hypothetical protein
LSQVKGGFSFATSTMPAGTEATVTAWKSAISAGSEANETAKESAKQAA